MLLMPQEYRRPTGCRLGQGTLAIWPGYGTGNTPDADGDGQLLRGRGLIQVTGRFNYEACSEALFGDSRLLNTPELLEHPVYASMSAGWFWQKEGLNSLADKGDMLAITKRINGGTNGLDDRMAIYKRALEVLQ